MAKSPAPLRHHAPGLPDGVYLDLDETAYHADSALGPSDIRRLRKGYNLYWHYSAMNPKRPEDKTTESKILGSALHALLLEGDAKLKKFFVRRPDDPKDATPPEKGQTTKAAKAKLLSHQELIHGDWWEFIHGVKSIIDEDEELRGCLDKGLSEVSVFWTRKDGVRCKARFDKLKLRGIGDIKSIANERERELGQACRLDIHTYRYDVQAAHYLEGRRQMVDLVKAGKVSQPNGFDVPNNKDDVAKLAFLDQVVAQKDFAFQFVFIPKTGAPDAWSCVLSPGNPILSMAQVDIETAINAYSMALERFGTKRWLPLRDVSELAVEEMPVGFGRN
jgi:hypothetical protein